MVVSKKLRIIGWLEFMAALFIVGIPLVYSAFHILGFLAFYTLDKWYSLTW